MNRLFEVGEVDTKEIAPPVVPDKLDLVRHCQAGWLAIMDGIPKNMRLGVAPLRRVGDKQLGEQIERCGRTVSEAGSLCARFCQETCVFTEADTSDPAQLRADVQEVLVGDPEESRCAELLSGVGGRAGGVAVTTPFQQVHSLFSRNAIPGSVRPISDMTPSTRQAVRTHFASTRLGEAAGLPAQIRLAV